MQYDKLTYTIFENLCQDCDCTTEQDEHTSEHWCENCQKAVKVNMIERKARYWTVAAYETSRAYGGPEEGGWYYTCGSLVAGTIRQFREGEDEESNSYINKLNNEFGGGEYITRIVYEKNAPDHFPKDRPRYS
jgi:hypothetical protein